MLVERVHYVFDQMADQQRRCGVGASAMRQCCSREGARSDLIASGALSVAPQAGRALFSCSAHDIHGCPTGPGPKHQCAVR